MLCMAVGSYANIHSSVPVVESCTAEKQRTIDRICSNVVAAISDSAGERVIVINIFDKNTSPSVAKVFRQTALFSQSMPLRGLLEWGKVIERDMRCSFEIGIPGASEQLQLSRTELLNDSCKDRGQLDTSLPGQGKNE